MITHAGPQVEVRFRRELRFLDIVMIGLGPTIGTTIFLLLGPGYAITGPSLILAFALNFFITLFTAMAYMELSSAFPEAGGGYLWIKESMPGPLGFLGGWLSWFGHCIVASFYVFGFGLGAVAVIRALQGGTEASLWGMGEEILTRILAVLVAVLFIFLNFRGTRITGRAATAVTGTLLGVVTSIVVFGLLYLLRGPGIDPASFTPFLKGTTDLSRFLALLGAMGFTFIVFQGYEIMAQAGEECKEPERTIPRATFLVIGLATLLFVMVAVVSIAVGGACVGTTPADSCLLVAMDGGVSGNPNALVGISAVVMPFGAAIAVFGIVLGALAATNALLFSASRVSFAMGRGGDLPKVMGQVHQRERTPHVAILVSGALIVLMTLTLDLETVAAGADVMFLLLFLQVNVAAIVLRRRRPDVKRWYTMPLFPLIPLMGIATKALLAFGLWSVEPRGWFLAAAWVVAGLGVYVLYERREVVLEAVRALEAHLPRILKRYRVLVAVENFGQDELVEFAALVAQVEDAELVLLHVIEVPQSLPLEGIDRTVVAKAETEMARMARAFRVATRPKVVLARRVFDAVMEALEDVDLLVLGWEGGPRKGRVLGTQIDRFVRRAPCDVVVLKTAGWRTPLRRVLVMNAPGWHASYATGYAILLARQHKAIVTILTVARTPAERESEARYVDRLAAICATHGVRHETEFLLSKDVASALAAEAGNYDLLAMGATEPGGPAPFVFGTTQDEIARRVGIPVLMVRKVTSRPSVVVKGGSA